MWSTSSLIWWFSRYCGVAPTILAGRIDPVLFEALYVSSHCQSVTGQPMNHWHEIQFSFCPCIVFVFCSQLFYMHLNMILFFLIFTILYFIAWLMWKRSVTGITTCNFSLCQDPTDMAELFCKWRPAFYPNRMYCSYVSNIG